MNLVVERLRLNGRVVGHVTAICCRVRRPLRSAGRGVWRGYEHMDTLEHHAGVDCDALLVRLLDRALRHI